LFEDFPFAGSEWLLPYVHFDLERSTHGRRQEAMLSLDSKPDQQHSFTALHNPLSPKISRTISRCNDALVKTQACQAPIVTPYSISCPRFGPRFSALLHLRSLLFPPSSPATRPCTSTSSLSPGHASLALTALVFVQQRVWHVCERYRLLKRHMAQPKSGDRDSRHLKMPENCWQVRLCRYCR
jgi:hypothetical protein